MIRVARIDGDEYICYCPMHDDLNASLYVNPKKNAAICFAGCYEGSAIGLVQKIDETLNRSAAWRAIVSNSIFSFEGLVYGQKKDCGVSPPINGLNWFPGDCSKYLINRGFSRSTVRYWGIEYCSEIKHIRIPVKDRGGNLVCYSYRTILKGIEPKYLHPGLPKKDGVLFGEQCFDSGLNQIHLVEGALDAVWMWQEGFGNSLAFLGSPAKKQIEKLAGKKDYTFNLWFDGDDAGIKATEKVVNVLQKNGLGYIIYTLPEGKDVMNFREKELKLMKRRD